MIEPSLHNTVDGSSPVYRALQVTGAHPLAQKKGHGAEEKEETNPAEHLELSDEAGEDEELDGNEQSPLVSALREETADEAGTGAEASQEEAAEGDSSAPGGSGDSIESLSNTAGEPVADPFADGSAGTLLGRTTQVPDSFVSNAGVDTPGDSSGSTVPSLTVDLGDGDVAKGQITREITNQQQALDQSKQAGDQSSNAGSKLQGEILRHQGEQSHINELSKSKQADAGEGQAQVENQKARIEEQSNSIAQVQEAGNARAAQVGQMQSGLSADQQAVADAGQALSDAQQAESDAQSAVDAAQQKVNDTSTPAASQAGKPGEGSSTEKSDEGNGKSQGSSKSAGKSQENQQKAAEASRQRAQEQAQQQYQAARQKLQQAQQQVQAAQQKQSAAQQKLQQDQVLVDRAKQGLGDFSKTLGTGVNARQATEHQMAQDQKTLQDDRDGLKHLASRSREVSGFIDQNKGALVTTGKVEQVSRDNVKAADQNIQQLTELLPKLGTEPPGGGGDADGRGTMHQAKNRLKATEMEDPSGTVPGGGSRGSQPESAGMEAANAAGMNSRATDATVHTSKRGDKLTIDLVSLKSAAAEVAGDSNAGGGKNQGYVGGIDGSGGAEIAAPEGSGNSTSSDSNPTINDSGGGGGNAQGADGHSDHGNGKSASAPGHNKH